MKKKFQLVTNCGWEGTKKYHVIEGEYETIEEALEVFGGKEVAYQQAIKDHCVCYKIEEVE